MSRKIHILFWLFVVTLTTFVIISLFSICNNLSEHDRLYFSIQGFFVENNDSITIGRNSNMSYRGLPHDYMTVKKMPDGKYSWKINEKYSFNREINDARIKNEKILLPVDDNGKIQFEFIEYYIKNLIKNMLQKYIEYLKVYMEYIKM